MLLLDVAGGDRFTLGQCLIRSKPEKLNASKCFPLCTLKPDIAEYGRDVRFVRNQTF